MQLYPHKHATVGWREVEHAGAAHDDGIAVIVGGRDEGVFGERGTHGGSPQGVDVAQGGEPGDPAMHAPCGEKGCYKGLRESGGREGGGFRDEAEAGDEGRLRGDPAQPAARSDGLAEGVEADDAAGGVQRDETGGEGFKECVFVRPRGRDGGGGGVLQIPVRIIFDDDDVEALAECVDGAAPCEAEGATGRVLTNGDSIQDVWTAALGAGVPVLEDVAEAAGAFGANALGVHANRDYADAVRNGGVDAVGVGEVLNEHVVAAFAEEGDGFAEAVGVAAR